jgi:O-acetyl-ADP-ribose deacetylase (regulator of RNase III)
MIETTVGETRVRILRGSLEDGDARAVVRDVEDEAIVVGEAREKEQGVIETRVPAWRGRFYGEKVELERAYQNSLVLAIERGYKTVAMGALGVEGRGFPAYEAMAVALNTIERVVTFEERRTSYRGAVERIDLYLAEEETFEVAKKVFRAYVHRWEIPSGAI